MRARDRVADFTAVDQDGKKVSLEGLLANGPLVLFFYPKAMTPG
jgi:peroxiredoxin Q/BCP